MQAYEKYKDSGIDWLGEIPEHWECKRLGTWFNEKKVKVSDKDFKPLSVTKNGIVPQLENAAKTNDGDNRKLVEKGDFVINSRSDRKGSSGLSFFEGSVSLINIVMTPKSLFGRYVNYLLKSYSFIEEFYRNGHGIVADLWTTRYDEMKFICLAIPPLHEQEAIAAFLDDKCGKIDEAVRIKEEQIKLLKEHRQIIIHDAVTKGLDNQAEMKDSGVDWIGEIPVHWEVKKVTHLFRKIGSGTTPTSGSVLYYVNGTINFLQTGDLNDDYIRDTGKKITEKALLDYPSLKLYPIGSLVIAMYGATIGKLGVLDVETTTNQACCVLGENSPCVSMQFVFYWFQFAKKNLVSMSYGGGQPNISQDLIKSLRLQVPPPHEQEQIVNYLKEQMSKIDHVIARKTEQIAKLKEYKQSLINEVVTGKIRVSGYT